LYGVLLLEIRRYENGPRIPKAAWRARQTQNRTDGKAGAFADGA
jgi:hypothetical protein